MTNNTIDKKYKVLAIVCVVLVFAAVIVMYAKEEVEEARVNRRQELIATIHREDEKYRTAVEQYLKDYINPDGSVHLYSVTDSYNGGPEEYNGYFRICHKVRVSLVAGDDFAGLSDDGKEAIIEAVYGQCLDGAHCLLKEYCPEIARLEDHSAAYEELGSLLFDDTVINVDVFCGADRYSYALYEHSSDRYDFYLNGEPVLKETSSDDAADRKDTDTGSGGNKKDTGTGSSINRIGGDGMPYYTDPDDYDNPEDYADDAWGIDFDDWDDAYDYWENW